MLFAEHVQVLTTVNLPLQALLVLQDTFLQKCYEKILMENLWICGHVVRSYCESHIQFTLRCLKGEKLYQVHYSVLQKIGV